MIQNPEPLPLLAAGGSFTAACNPASRSPSLAGPNHLRCPWLYKVLTPPLWWMQSTITRVVRPTDIEICKRPDGSDWQLGYGTFGEVLRPKACMPNACSVQMLHEGTTQQSVMCLTLQSLLIGDGNAL